MLYCASSSSLMAQIRMASVFQDRYFYRWQLVNEGTPHAFDWKIVKDELVQKDGLIEGYALPVTAPASRKSISRPPGSISNTRAIQNSTLKCIRQR